MSTEGIKSDIVGMWRGIAPMRVNELLCTYGDSQQKCSHRAAKAARGKEVCNMFSGALAIKSFGAGIIFF